MVDLAPAGVTPEEREKFVKAATALGSEVNRAFEALGGQLRASVEGAAKAFQALRPYLPVEKPKGREGRYIGEMRALDRRRAKLARRGCI